MPRKTQARRTMRRPQAQYPRGMQPASGTGINGCMPYDNKGRPILDGKPYDEDDATMEKVLEGLSLDGRALATARKARIKARAQRIVSTACPPELPKSKP
jgi:hypothetical protein